MDLRGAGQASFNKIMQTSMMNESVPAPLRQPKIPVLSNFKKMRGRYEVNFEGKTSSF